MIIDASPTPALLLLCIGQACQVTIVIVAPHQRDVIGHTQSALHNLEHLLIRNKDLRHLLHILTVVLPDKLALVVDDLLKSRKLFLFGLHTFHRPIVDSTHANGKEFL